MAHKGIRSKSQKRQEAIAKPPIEAASLLLPEQSHGPVAPNGSQQRRVLYHESYSGPLPHPTILAGLDHLVPGAAGKVIDQFVAQGDHRRELEKKALEIEGRNSLLGIIFAGSIVVLSIIVGGLLVWNGKTTEGLWFSGTPTATVACAFIYGTNQRRKERMEKARNNPPPTTQVQDGKAQKR